MSLTKTAFELDISHPNYLRWQRAIDYAVERGDLVCKILEDFIRLKDSTILDAGCGVGGTSIALAGHGAKVTALDRDPARLETLRQRNPAIDLKQAELEDLPFPEESFNGIVLQDVLEHVRDPKQVLHEVQRSQAADQHEGEGPHRRSTEPDGLLHRRLVGPFIGGHIFVTWFHHIPKR